MEAEIIKRLNAVFQNVFNDESIQIHDETTAADIVDWDSLMHISLLVAVEREFGVKFSTGEISKLENVGSLLAAVIAKS